MTNKVRLGFKNGYITIFKGNTFPYKDWLKEAGAKYHKFWGWYFPAGAALPDRLPCDLEYDHLTWEEISFPGEDTLRNESEIQNIIQSHRYGESSSSFQGVIGERLTFEGKVTKVIEGIGYYGPYVMNVLEDKQGNIYVWSTSRTLQRGEIYKVRGWIKAHETYRGVRQTIITRCKIL